MDRQIQQAQEVSPENNMWTVYVQALERFGQNSCEVSAKSRETWRETTVKEQ
jgi:hypothetical protein